MGLTEGPNVDKVGRSVIGLAVGTETGVSVGNVLGFKLGF